MKIQLLGFFPFIAMYIWGIWYLKKNDCDELDPLRFLALLFVISVTAIILGLSFIWGLTAII